MLGHHRHELLVTHFPILIDIELRHQNFHLRWGQIESKLPVDRDGCVEQLQQRSAANAVPQSSEWPGQWRKAMVVVFGVVVVLSVLLWG